MSELNDPRVLIAAERTLLAWNRTSVSLMAFGFVVERFGLFIQMMGRTEFKIYQREFSFYTGLVFIALSIVMNFTSIVQYKRVVSAGLKPSEIPEGYNIWSAVWMNGIVGVLGIILVIYLIHSF